MKKLTAVLLVIAMIIAFAACGPSNNSGNIVPSGNNSNTSDSSNTENSIKPEPIKPMTYSQFVSAAADSEVAVEGYLQGWAYSKQQGNVGLYIMNDDGNFYAYRVVCDDATAASFSEGIKVRVEGLKAYWEGFHEVKEGGKVEILGGTKVYDPVDVTESLADTDSMVRMQGAKVCVTGAVISPKQLEGKDAAFLYNWNGSGAEGNNNDLYIDIKIGENVFTAVVESDETPEGSDTYKAVTGLQIGQTVDIEGFMYWYQGPQIHIHSISVR